MSKYSNEQLKEMAIEALEAKKFGDERYFHLIIRLAQATGIHPQECENKIIEYANMELA